MNLLQQTLRGYDSIIVACERRAAELEQRARAHPEHAEMLLAEAAQERERAARERKARAKLDAANGGRTH